jgi:hypothetical protein
LEASLSFGLNWCISFFLKPEEYNHGRDKRSLLPVFWISPDVNDKTDCGLDLRNCGKNLSLLKMGTMKDPFATEDNTQTDSPLP